MVTLIPEVHLVTHRTYFSSHGCFGAILPERLSSFIVLISMINRSYKVTIISRYLRRVSVTPTD